MLKLGRFPQIVLDSGQTDWFFGVPKGSGCINWPRGPMDKASTYGAGDCRFESYRGHRCGWPSCKVVNACTHRATCHGRRQCKRSRVQFPAATSTNAFKEFPHISISELNSRIGPCSSKSVGREKRQRDASAPFCAPVQLTQALTNKLYIF